jgi:hypothetical protein
MTYDEIKPGQKLWWRHSRCGLTTWKAARVIKMTPQRVAVWVKDQRGAARKCVRASRLSRKPHGPE